MQKLLSPDLSNRMTSRTPSLLSECVQHYLGRWQIEKENLPFQVRHPIILPRDSHNVRLILRYVHQGTKHQGRGTTLNKLCSYGYWIVGGSKLISNFRLQCLVCRSMRRPTESQKIADLSQDCVKPFPPFTFCDMDCFGPFIVKQGCKELKRYGLLINCMYSQAIHIGMLDDMSTDAFINSLCCFIAIRGAVQQIQTNQGSNFIGGRNKFKKGKKH